MTVACPSFKCKKAVALNHVMDHVTNDCKFASTECCQMVATSTWSQTYEIPVENIVDRHIILDRVLPDGGHLNLVPDVRDTRGEYRGQAHHPRQTAARWWPPQPGPRRTRYPWRISWTGTSSSTD